MEIGRYGWWGKKICVGRYVRTGYCRILIPLQVRAGSLQELVYKGGQAGVTKATVTITFDNHDKKQSPLGYESYDELTVSRQVSFRESWCV